MNMQVFTVPKNDNTITVDFPKPWTTPPIVLTTSVFATANVAVDYLKAVTSDNCTISSSNTAPGYFVDILAVDAGAGSFGSLHCVAGIQTKIPEKISIDISAGKLTSPDPVTIITANWASGTGNLGAVDTVNQLAASEFGVVSANSAADYRVSYISADIGIGTQNGQVMQTGIANKLGTAWPAVATLRVYFSVPFKSVPTVFLTPWWNHAGASVRDVETLVTTTRDYFECTSSNQGETYFVNWMAFGT